MTRSQRCPLTTTHKIGERMWVKHHIKRSQKWDWCSWWLMLMLMMIVALVWSMKEFKLLCWVGPRPLLLLFHKTWFRYEVDSSRRHSFHSSLFWHSVHCLALFYSFCKVGPWQGWGLLRAILYYGSGTASNLPKPANILISTAPQIITHKYFIHFCHMQHQYHPRINSQSWVECGSW